MPDAPDDLLTAQEAMKLLRIHHQTLYNWCKSGKIAHVRLGTEPWARIRIRRSTIDALLAVAPTT